jgi:hypothetical protein
MSHGSSADAARSLAHVSSRCSSPPYHRMAGGRCAQCILEHVRTQPAHHVLDRAGRHSDDDVRQSTLWEYAEYPVGVPRVPCGSTQSTLWEYAEYPVGVPRVPVGVPRVPCGSTQNDVCHLLDRVCAGCHSDDTPLQRSTSYCNTALHVAAQYSILQHSTSCCNIAHYVAAQAPHSCCNTRTMLQRSAAQRSAAHPVATQ